MLHRTKSYNMGGGHRLVLTQAEVSGFRVVHEVQPLTSNAQHRDVWYIHPDAALALPLVDREARKWMKRTWRTLLTMKEDLDRLRKLVGPKAVLPPAPMPDARAVQALPKDVFVHLEGMMNGARL